MSVRVVVTGSMMLASALVACADVPSGDAGADATVTAVHDATATTLDASGCSMMGAQAYVLSGLLFARQNPPGTSVGFDLDDHVGGDVDSCNKSDFVDPDGVRGIDNQLSLLVPALDAMTGGAIDGLIAGAINNGQLLVGVELSGIDDCRNDESVNITIRPAAGMPTVGSDGVIDNWQTFDGQPDAATSHTTGRLHDGVFDAGPFDLALPVQILDARFTLALHGARVRLRPNADGSATGSIGGGIDTGDIVQITSGLNIRNELMSTIRTVVNSVADLDHQSDGKCHQFSAAITFTAKSAFLNP